MKNVVKPWKDVKDSINRWSEPARPFREIYQSWLDTGRAEILTEVVAGMPLIEAISFHTSTALFDSPSVLVRMILWRDMATES